MKATIETGLTLLELNLIMVVKNLHDDASDTLTGFTGLIMSMETEASAPSIND
ncbi:hypothetical protein [Companilactobacillus bobalius]|uniref:Uncharacterized protein n=1 Tax=Companilactobacillus bobalius DSM 19674 TaxID=1423788 RepID=A0A0R1KN69_9LACO|nr:hypothetical protein [Companilactobacillus bobalius]KRK83043.1 hypothetical protein FC78_GL001851 [Companilactobacillus bobalius DSM 19674]